MQAAGLELRMLAALDARIPDGMPMPKPAVSANYRRHDCCYFGAELLIESESAPLEEEIRHPSRRRGRRENRGRGRLRHSHMHREQARCNNLCIAGAGPPAGGARPKDES